METWVLIAKIVGFTFAMGFGGAAVGVPTWVLGKTKHLATQPLCLAALGVALIGSPTWAVIQAEAGWFKFNARQQAQIDDLEKKVVQIDDLKKQVAQIDALRKQVAANAAVSQALTVSQVNSPGFRADQSEATRSLYNWSAQAKKQELWKEVPSSDPWQGVISGGASPQRGTFDPFGTRDEQGNPVVPTNP